MSHTEIKNLKKEQSHNYGAKVHKTTLNYTDQLLLLEIEGLARDGYDDQQIAELLDVSRQTFCKNKNKKLPITGENPTGDSHLSQSLKKGRRPLNVLVENSMYKRAVGQVVKTITKTKKWLVVDGKPKQYVDVTETETELPGDVNAQSFWLRHRKPEIYNQQPQKVDLTSMGEKLAANEPPRITNIHHVTISDTEIKKSNGEDDFTSYNRLNN